MKEDIDQKNWDSYLIKDTNVLKNNYNITNNEELKETEKIITRKNLTKLYLSPIKGNFDLEHLKLIHKCIFFNIYPFAGEIRTCSLQKNDHIFCYPEEIEKRIIETLASMNEEFNEDIYSISEFAFKLSSYYFELISIHPFREGNGRSIRVYIRDFVVEKSKGKSCGNLDLDYTKINKENLMLGTAQRYIYSSHLEMEFMKGLVPVSEIKNKHK